MGSGGKTRTSDVQGWDSARGNRMDDNGPPHKREVKIQVYSGSRGVVEGVLSCG